MPNVEGSNPFARFSLDKVSDQKWSSEGHY